MREAQRRGAVRHGVSTGTLADASQSAWSQGQGRLPAVADAAAVPDAAAAAGLRSELTEHPRRPVSLDAAHLEADGRTAAGAVAHSFMEEHTMAAQAAAPNTAPHASPGVAAAAEPQQDAVSGHRAVPIALRRANGASAAAGDAGAGGNNESPAAEDAGFGDERLRAGLADRDRVSPSPETPREGQRLALPGTRAPPAGAAKADPSHRHAAATERLADCRVESAPCSAEIPLTGACSVSLLQH